MAFVTADIVEPVWLLPLLPDINKMQMTIVKWSDQWGKLELIAFGKPEKAKVGGI